MKLGNLLPPLFVLLGGAIWLGSQSVTLTRLEKENKELGSRISAQHSRPKSTATDRPSAAMDRTKPTPTKGNDGDSPINWKELASQLVEMHRGNGTGDVRTMIRLQQRLLSMSAEELVVALEEISTLDLSDEEQMTLEQALSGPLAEKDPQMALERFLPRLDEKQGIWGWQLSHAMKSWASKDLASAVAWFDRQIVDGKFEAKSLDGKSQFRIQFEGALLSVMLRSDPAAASLRLAALPENQRAEVLGHHELSEIKEANQTSFANIVREQLPEKDRAKTLAHPASQIASKSGYTEVTTYLDRIQAQGNERSAIVEQAAEGRLRTLSHSKPLTTEEIDEMRTWAATQSPGSENKATGKALAELSGFQDKAQFAKMAALAVQYHESTGNDEVLASFLDGWSIHSNREAARDLAGKIRDAEKREKILKNLR